MLWMSLLLEGLGRNNHDSLRFVLVRIGRIVTPPTLHNDVWLAACVGLLSLLLVNGWIGRQKLVVASSRRCLVTTE